MDERQKRILASLVAGSALSLTLGVTASAEGVETPEAELTPAASQAPQTPATNGENNTNTENSTSGTETTDKTETTGTETTGTETTDETETTGTETTGAGSSTPEGTAALESVTYTAPETTPAETETEPPVLTVENGALTSGDQNWDDGNKAGLRFDEDSGSVVMVNNSNAVTIQTDSKGVNLSVAGVNRISTLYADGDVNITGTGIVLIDSIDMLQGTNLNLLTNTNIYAEGSAAVFLRNPETGSYELINGSVSGILDEEYTIPEGVTLVVPEGGTLDMRVTTTVTTTTDGTQTETHYGFTDEEKSILESDSEEEKKIFTEGVQQEGVLVQKSVIFSTPKLNIAADSVLHIQEGGQLLMNAFRNEPLGVVNSSTLEVSGILGLDGNISAYQGSGVGQAENFYLNVKDGGCVAGEGTLSGVTAVYETGAGDEDTLNIAGDGSYVKINNGGIANLSTTGNTGVVFENGASIGSVAATGSGRLTFYGVNFTDQMQANALSGSYSIGSGYVKVGTVFAGESFSAPAQSIPFLSNGGVMGQRETSVAHLEFWKDMGTLGKESTFWKSGSLTGFGSAIDYSFLSGNSTTRGFDFYEVFVQEGDTLKLYLLNRDSTQSLSVENICQIRGVNFNSGITVGGTVLNGATNAGWTSGTGWRYDGASVSMVNNGAAVDIKAEGKGVDFSVAGLNRIGTLYADADVNITGTGIVLIDSLDLKEGTKLNLLTNTGIYADGTGSAAVFLKNENGEYVLINGNVVGILDEEYTIPSGITLVVPDGGKLDMRVTTSVTTTTAVEKNGTTTTQTETHYGITQDDKDNKIAFERPQQTEYTQGGESWTTTVSKSIGFTVPELNISSNAVLRIQQGAQLLMQAFKDCITNLNRSSTLNVFGDLELDGQMQTTGDTQNGTDGSLWLNVKSGGSVTGDGTITNATIRYEAGAGNGDRLNIAGDRNLIELNSSGIGTLYVNGKADLYYADNVTMGSVSVAAAEGSDNGITFYGKKELNRLNISDSITGSYTISSGYLTVNGNYANMTFDTTTAGTPIPTEICVAPTSGGSSGIEFKPGDSFPYVSNTNTAGFGFTPIEGGYSGSTISWSGLTGLISNIDEYSVFEVYTRGADGKVTMHLLQNGDKDMETTGVFLIRAVKFTIYPIGFGGAGDISTGTSTTGSGVLGGENAGSLTGGNASGILSGGRDTQTGGQNDTLTGTNTGATGSGVLGGGSALAGGNAIGVLGGNRQPPAPPTIPATPQGANQAATTNQEVSEYDLVLKVTGSGTQYDLKAFYDGIELKELGGGTVKVELEVQLNPGWDPQDVFAVFRDAQGKLVAVRARYDQRTGKLTFDAPMLGQFRLVYLDWDGTDYTDEAFLAAIAACLN